MESFAAEERADMVEDDGKVRVTCEYCSRVYEVRDFGDSALTSNRAPPMQPRDPLDRPAGWAARDQGRVLLSPRERWPGSAGSEREERSAGELSA